MAKLDLNQLQPRLPLITVSETRGPWKEKGALPPLSEVLASHPLRGSGSISLLNLHSLESPLRSSPSISPKSINNSKVLPPIHITLGRYFKRIPVLPLLGVNEMPRLCSVLDSEPTGPRHDSTQELFMLQRDSPDLTPDLTPSADASANNAPSAPAVSFSRARSLQKKIHHTAACPHEISSTTEKSRAAGHRTRNKSIRSGSGTSTDIIATPRNYQCHQPGCMSSIFQTPYGLRYD